MKLFVFEPSKKWDYCGGMILIAARKFSECHSLIKKYEETQGYSEDAKILLGSSGIDDWRLHMTDSDEYGVDDWYLKTCLELAPDAVVEAAVISVNYNFA